MTRLRLSYANIEHGGRTEAGYSAYSGDGGHYDYTKVTAMVHDGDWPDILIIGEGDRYELNGMEGAHEAAAALRDAGGPAYVPYPCSLPREWGMFAPVIYIDPTKVVVRRFYSHRLPDFAARNRNLMLFTLPGRRDPFRIAVTHGDIYSGDTRLADNHRFDRLADPAIPCALLGDWNTVPSGPHFEPTDMNTPACTTRAPSTTASNGKGEPGRPARTSTTPEPWTPWSDGGTPPRANGKAASASTTPPNSPRTTPPRRSNGPTAASAWSSTASSSTTRSATPTCPAPTASTTSATPSTPTPTTNASA